MLTLPILGVLGVRGPVLVVPFVLSLAAIVLGTVLAWTSEIPLQKVREELLGAAGYGCGRRDRVRLVRRMILKDVVMMGVEQMAPKQPDPDPTHGLFGWVDTRLVPVFSRWNALTMALTIAMVVLFVTGVLAVWT